MRLDKKLWYNFKNIPGWSTSRKILVIEADDYGSIYMPSKTVFNKLSKVDSSILQSKYCKYDNLESSSDLESLLEALSVFKDINGQSAKLTPFFNPANPDIASIKKTGLASYKYFNYTKSQEFIYGNTDVDALWRNALQSNLLQPQYHGREHVNVPLLMQLLKNNPEFDKYFDENFYHPKVKLYPLFKSLRAAFFFREESEKMYLKKSLKEGITLFKDYFNYSPKVFCPSNGVFHDDFKSTLSSEGIKAVVESGVRKIPDGRGGQKTKRKFVFGKYEKQYNTLRYSRNVVFEPNQTGIDKAVSKALNTMEQVYRWNKPAVIATHRVNFSGEFDEKNRSNGLKALKQLIMKAQAKWPEIEFMHSAELTNLILEDKFKDNVSK